MALSKIEAFYCYQKAKQLRKKGKYDLKALKYFLKAYQLSRSKFYLLEYIKYRRDLGRLLAPSLASKVLSIWQRLNQKEQSLMAAFFLESGREVISFEPTSKSSIPATLAYKSFYALSEQQQLLLSIYAEQAQWRAQLAEALKAQAKAQGICVVGNSGVMKGSALGSVIDSTGFVVRFNAFQEGLQVSSDLGTQCQAWCVTPSFKMTSVLQVPWLIVLGPEVQYRLADWSQFYAFREQRIPIITIPLGVWRQLVSELKAPPSAGITILAFFYGLLGSWSGVAVAGFGALASTLVPYHYMSAKHTASERHNWLGEQRLLERWLAEGLTSLHD